MQGSTKISFIGFGEAGQAFASGLLQESKSLDLCAFDIKTTMSDAAKIRAAYDKLNVSGVDRCEQACTNRTAIFSLVTAEQAEIAAAAAAKADLDRALFFDCNSCAPNTKRRSADAIEGAGGRYVDVAVMTPVHPRLHKSPCLLAGPHAEAAHEVYMALGMNAEVAGPQVGDASTRKMIRSVMIKGLEALTLECFLAARKAGIEDDIVASLEAGFPGFGWDKRAPYMMERMATHGIRRAAEMEEVAKTLRNLGLTPQITERTVLRQREMGALGLKVTEAQAQDLAGLADTILAAMAAQKDTKE